jgi:hypothetical protein
MQVLPDGSVIVRAQKATTTPAKRADGERRRRKDESIMVDNVMRFYYSLSLSACLFGLPLFRCMSGASSVDW